MEATQAASNSAATVPMLFVHGQDGTPLRFFVEPAEIPSRTRITLRKKIKQFGGELVNKAGDATFILVWDDKADGQRYARIWGDEPGKFVIGLDWVYDCIKAKRFLGKESDFGGNMINITQGPILPRADNAEEEQEVTNDVFAGAEPLEKPVEPPYNLPQPAVSAPFHSQVVTSSTDIRSGAASKSKEPARSDRPHPPVQTSSQWRMPAYQPRTTTYDPRDSAYHPRTAPLSAPVHKALTSSVDPSHVGALTLLAGRRSSPPAAQSSVQPNAAPSFPPSTRPDLSISQSLAASLGSSIPKTEDSNQNLQKRSPLRNPTFGSPALGGAGSEGSNPTYTQVPSHFLSSQQSPASRDLSPVSRQPPSQTVTARQSPLRTSTKDTNASLGVASLLRYLDGSAGSSSVPQKTNSGGHSAMQAESNSSTSYTLPSPAANGVVRMFQSLEKQTSETRPATSQPAIGNVPQESITSNPSSLALPRTNVSLNVPAKTTSVTATVGNLRGSLHSSSLGKPRSIFSISHPERPAQQVQVAPAMHSPASGSGMVRKTTTPSRAPFLPHGTPVSGKNSAVPPDARPLVSNPAPTPVAAVPHLSSATGLSIQAARRPLSAVLTPDIGRTGTVSAVNTPAQVMQASALERSRSRLTTSSTDSLRHSAAELWSNPSTSPSIAPSSTVVDDMTVSPVSQSRVKNEKRKLDEETAIAVTKPFKKRSRLTRTENSKNNIQMLSRAAAHPAPPLSPHLAGPASSQGSSISLLFVDSDGKPFTFWVQPDAKGRIPLLNTLRNRGATIEPSLSECDYALLQPSSTAFPRALILALESNACPLRTTWVDACVKAGECVPTDDYILQKSDVPGKPRGLSSVVGSPLKGPVRTKTEPGTIVKAEDTDYMTVSTPRKRQSLPGAGGSQKGSSSHVAAASRFVDSETLSPSPTPGNRLPKVPIPLSSFGIKRELEVGQELKPVKRPRVEHAASAFTKPLSNVPMKQTDN